MDELNNNLNDTQTTGEQQAIEAPNIPTREQPKAQQQEPSTADLQKQLQDLMVENARFKKAITKATAEASEYKKRYNSTLSEQEQASLEKAEEEAERQAKFESMERELNITRLEKQYLAMKYTSEEAEKMAVAEADNDVDAKIKIMQEVEARKRREYEAEFIKNRPLVNAGVGGENPNITKEVFKTLGYKERLEFKEKYPETYKAYTE